MIRTIIVALEVVIFLILEIPFLGVTYLIGKKDAEKAERITLAVIRGECRMICFLTSTRVRVTGRENIPTDRPVLYVGNHNSVFDVVTVYPYLVDRCGFLAKKELLKVPLLSWLMVRTHSLFLNRQDPREGMKTILAAIDNIKSGVSMFVFPEGTRSKTGELGEFKAGCFKIASKTDCPIVPVTITKTANILKKHMPFIKANVVTISFGQPEIPSQMDEDVKKHIGEHFRDEIAANLPNGSAW